jgi:probable rRNA maturation factor
MKVYFQNFKCHWCIKRKIKKLFLSALDEIHIEFKGFSVNITLNSVEEMQSLNKQFKNKSVPTDVLSFPAFEFNKGKNFNYKEMAKEIDKDDGLISLGDIAICQKIAKEQAKSFKHSFKREICFLALHGFLHLLGYDHSSKEEENEMNFLAESLLNSHKVKRK